MKYLTILFDFDGTLADTGAVVLDIVNELAREFGYKPVASEEIPTLRKMSAWQLLRERSGIPLWNIFKMWRLERRVREKFERHADDVRLFAGVPEMIQNLRAAGYEVGIVSSNSLEVIQFVLHQEGVDVNFIHAGSKFFSKARAVRQALQEYDVDPTHTVYVGDELRDVEACKKVGIDMFAVGWGFNAPGALRASGATVASTPEELLRMLTA